MVAQTFGNVFAGLSKLTGNRDEELVERLNPHGGVRIERIVSTGQSSPPGFWYDQTEEEWVLLIEGAARLEYDDGRAQDLLPGDWVHLPAHCRHRVASTDPNKPTLWLAVFYPPADSARE